MNTIAKSITAAAVVGAVALAGTLPAAAAWHHHYYHHPYPVAPYAYSYYPSYPAYSPYYYDPGAAIAAGVSGGIFGTIVHGALDHHCVHVYHHNGKTYCR
jgi:hypothetical protein